MSDTRKPYRPPGFKNPYEPNGYATEEYLDHGARDKSIFEAGADAMQEGLKKGIKPTLKPGRIGDSFVGYAVFIPEEE